MNKIVCYTCITGGYDTLNKVSPVDGIDFVCFTDNLGICPNGWKIFPIPSDLDGLSDVKKQRIIKICPHRYLKDYSVSLWVDANFDISTNNLHKFIQEFNLNEIHFYTKKHPSRNCIYQEGNILKKLSRTSILTNDINKQLNKYQSQYNYPANAGLFETGIILRKHNEHDCVLLDNMWASEVLIHTHRDQLSLNFCSYQLHTKIGFIPDKYWRPVKTGFFRLHSHLGDAAYNVTSFELTVGIVNYNTTKLTNCLIKSIRKQFHGHTYCIKVFDNSDKDKFISEDQDVIILDNTAQQLIDYSKIISQCTEESPNNYANIKHTLAIDYLLKNSNTFGLILFDSDTLLIKNIDFVDYNYLTIAQVSQPQHTPQGITRKERFFPFIQFFNLKMLRDLHINYFDFNRILYSGTPTSKYYDTGASFYEDTVNSHTKYRQIKYSDYIVHSLAGSWARSDQIDQFLKQNKHYYE